jgi:hypothetical protein
MSCGTEVTASSVVVHTRTSVISVAGRLSVPKQSELGRSGLVATTPTASGSTRAVIQRVPGPDPYVIDVSGIDVDATIGTVDVDALDTAMVDTDTADVGMVDVEIVDLALML